MRLALVLPLFCCFISGSHAIIPDTLNDYKMVVTWGKPRAGASTSLQISWEECLQTCWKDEECVLIYDTSPICEYYTVITLRYIDKLPRSSHSRIAFRVLRRSQTCTWRENEPLLMEGTIKSDVQRSPPTYVLYSYIPFNITFKSEVWTISGENPEYFCPNLAVPVRRGTKIWCMSVVNSYRCLNQTEASALCTTIYNGSLAGVANQEEYKLLKTKAVDLLKDAGIPSGYESYGFWVDGVRKSTCTDLTLCKGTNEFAYKDPYGQNPALEWNPGQPDGLSKNTKDDCVALIVKQGKAGIEDIKCGMKEQPSTKLCMLGVYCGLELGPEDWSYKTKMPYQ